MTEIKVVKPSLVESAEQWMKNLIRSETPCFLCKHKAGGEDLFELVCDAFPGTLIPPFIFNSTMNHSTIFKGNISKTNVFTNKYAKQKTDKVFEFDDSFRIVNELLKHPYTIMINELSPGEAEAFKRDIQDVVNRIKEK